MLPVLFEPVLFEPVLFELVRFESVRFVSALFVSAAPQPTASNKEKTLRLSCVVACLQFLRPIIFIWKCSVLTSLIDPNQRRKFRD